MNEIKLHDIKPIFEIQEYSLYYLLGTILLGIILTCSIAYMLYYFYKRKNAYNLKKEHLKLLNSINLQDTKQSAYDITLYGASFKNDTPEHFKTYKKLVHNLQHYKYKRYINSFDEGILKDINHYKEICNA